MYVQDNIFDWTKVLQFVDLTWYITITQSLLLLADKTIDRVHHYYHYCHLNVYPINWISVVCTDRQTDGRSVDVVSGDRYMPYPLSSPTPPHVIYYLLRVLVEQYAARLWVGRVLSLCWRTRLGVGCCWNQSNTVKRYGWTFYFVNGSRDFVEMRWNYLFKYVEMISLELDFRKTDLPVQTNLFTLKSSFF